MDIPPEVSSSVVTYPVDSKSVVEHTLHRTTIHPTASLELATITGAYPSQGSLIPLSSLLSSYNGSCCRFQFQFQCSLSILIRLSNPILRILSSFVFPSEHRSGGPHQSTVDSALSSSQALIRVSTQEYRLDLPDLPESIISNHSLQLLVLLCPLCAFLRIRKLLSHSTMFQLPFNLPCPPKMIVSQLDYQFINQLRNLTEEVNNILA